MAELAAGPDSVRLAAAQLSDDERNRADAFTRDSDRRRYVLARARLRQLLAEQLGIAPREVEFVYGRCGKPRLSSRHGHTPLTFNVSRCGDLAALAVAVARPIGVDIEAIRLLPDADGIADIAFSRRERSEFRALDPQDRPLGFFNCWTRKEAFVKALGDGLRHPLHAFDVSLTPGQPAIVRRVGRAHGNRTGWELRAFTPAPGFVGAIAIPAVALRAAATPPLPNVLVQCDREPVGVFAS
jgi:4'-phosphopantetheinyl transferase